MTLMTWVLVTEVIRHSDWYMITNPTPMYWICGEASVLKSSCSGKAPWWSPLWSHPPSPHIQSPISIPSSLFGHCEFDPSQKQICQRSLSPNLRCYGWGKWWLKRWCGLRSHSQSWNHQSWNLASRSLILSRERNLLPLSDLFFTKEDL